jgi:hypothetical protein
MLDSHKIHTILRIKINYINGEKKILRTKTIDDYDAKREN